MNSTKKTINGNEYEMLHFGSKLSLRLASQIADALKVDADTDTTNIQGMVIKLIANDKFPDLVERLCEGITYKGMKIDFDSHFSDYRKDLLPCVGMSLKENIVPFFDPRALESLFETALADLA